MTAPANGAPAAAPTVKAELSRPFASPRAAAGTIRIRLSLAAVMLGAQSSPLGSSARMIQGQPGVSPTGMVRAAMAATRTSADTGRRTAPKTRPPVRE